MKKTTFLKPDDFDNPSQKHLNIVISDPDSENEVLIVNLTKWKEKKYNDTSCIIHEGEHQFVKYKSVIYYRKPHVCSASFLLELKFKGKIIMKNDISDELLKRIQDGARKSIHLPEEFKKYFLNF